ncbi:MAG: amino acid permease [Actinomycetota bacterium]
MVSQRSRNGTLGTFAGVFTPSILTILGIILFLRMGFVVGNAGLTRSLIIIGIATAVSVLTSISLAAIATNIEVKGGGDYYLISRTLGVEFGGAIGIVLFLAQSVSIAFYAVGFGEVTAQVLGIESPVGIQLIAAAAVLVLFVLAWAGADVATRFQFVVMAFLVAALLSFYAGAFGSTSSGILADGLSPATGALGFWAVFAIFFPAVTGFTQGVSMSGDLADPAQSLPRGTFAAVGISTVVYVTAAILIASSVPQADLVDDTGQAMRSIGLIGPLITFGVIAATLSSAMASFLGAPRILQSLAADRVFPFLHVFAKGHGPHANPRHAVLLSLGIAMLTLGLGGLNAIAAVVSMFFLISYGMLNYATYWEARANSPSFRPRFRFFDQRLSLAGAAISLLVMLAINALAGAVALIVLFSIYQHLSRRRRVDRWADAAPSHSFQRAKESIRALSHEEIHARNWRPQVLAFSADPNRRERLLRFGSWLEGGSGLTAVFRIMEGKGALMRRERDAEQERLERQVEDLDLDVYARAVLASDGMEALPVVVQSFGLGGLKANTALFGWPENAEAERRHLFVQSLREVVRLGVNVVTMSSDEQRWGALSGRDSKSRRIDVWWSDDDSSRLALLAAYLFTRTPDWSKATMRVLTSAPQDEADPIRTSLEDLLTEARIPAEAICLIDADPETIISACADAALVIAPMRIHREETLGPLDTDLDSLLQRLPLTAAVLSAQPVDLLAGPESGHHVTLADAEDAVEDAETRLHALERRLAGIDRDLAGARERHDAGDSGAAEEVEDLTRERQTVMRRTLKARVRVESARSEVAALLGERS